MIELSERIFEGHGLTVFENERLLFGYSAMGFTSTALQRFLAGRPLLFLKQTHSDHILYQADWLPAAAGDGLILQRPGAAAVIQTADCLPLFFFNDDQSRGGVIHVGWRGLHQGIEAKLISLLGNDSGKYVFYLGPGIERKCYEVGEELPVLFRDKTYADRIFAALGGGKYSMDLKHGLTLSLRTAGIVPERIRDSGLCTYCSKGRFPSYRRDGKTGKRIFNFIILKDPAAATM
ncbi:MAG TPA: polyphenol oxidase family protein [Patescibacteria group bacterium]|nr:polyphenol oxidase family protein [Patescibacteria group bacterium]